MSQDLITIQLKWAGEEYSYIDAVVNPGYYYLLSEEEEKEIIKVLEDLVESCKEFGFPFLNRRRLMIAKEE
ncbi:hypothetical protein DRW41_17235 [Neobacillus piezotolerans]|uniref:Uncharacterized protein n=1 Tax=Neobacillus piezotolerans TaxID=2259171 RepID=A0A3D8GLY7_9BACI|nr:hypothetical protein [Neobacillus piezotolerans]RDU35484.1 hypothetical protein DRW41_17235 [Neobacillus piezotolerans]